MIGILRFIGLMNAAIWFGSAFCFIVVPFAFFSQEMLSYFSVGYAGLAAQIVFKRYFVLQNVCATIAVIHLLATWLYLGRPLQRLGFWLVMVLFGLSLLGSFGIQPKLRRLHQEKYTPSLPVEKREAAAKSFGRWHGLSEVVQFALVCGLIGYLYRLANPPDAPRFVSSAKFRG